MTRPTLKPLAAAIFLASLYGNAVADTFEAADEAGLRDAIHQVNSLPGTHFIVLTNNITLTDALPPVLNNVTVQGNNFTLTGSGDQRLLLIGAGQEGSGPRILVHLNNLTLGQGVAAGGDGADGGGGGMGAGGAVF